MSATITPRALLFGGNWALAHGDVEALAHVARALADRVHGPLGGNLRELAALCFTDGDRAAIAWRDLHDAVTTSLCTSSCGVAR